MTRNPFCGNAPALPYETVNEVSDGIALALDALDIDRPLRADLDEARRHLRFASRRVRKIIDSQSLSS